MDNALGKLKATPPPAPAAADDSAASTDSTLPDPTRIAKWALGILMLAALAVALIWNGVAHTGSPFKPAADNTANFALFAGFYAAAQVIERLLELVAPVLPFWNVPDPPDGGSTSAAAKATAKAAQVKADRATAVHGIAAVLGVAASCGFGLFFLQAVGMSVSNTIDTFATGVLIAAGTKPLHDFITSIQNKNSPSTGTQTDG